MPRRNQTPRHQPFNFSDACQQKRRFTTEKLALDAAEHQMLLNQNLELSVYKCDACNGWHLTRRKASGFYAN